MSWPTEYQIYFSNLFRQYEERGRKIPDKAKNTYELYNKLLSVESKYAFRCQKSAIPKEMMKELLELKISDYSGYPKEIGDAAAEIDAELVAMTCDLFSDKDAHFINEWTLSHRGRHVMRAHLDKILDIENRLRQLQPQEDYDWE